MSANTSYDFTVNKEHNTITVKREFAAPLAVIWDAFTKSEILDQWWAPKPWKTITTSMDFKEGGMWYYSMVSTEGEAHWSSAGFSNIQFQKKYNMHDAFTYPDGMVNHNLPQADWEVTFTERGDTMLVELYITYSDLAQLNAFLSMGFKEGLAAAMEGLDELLPSLKK